MRDLNNIPALNEAGEKKFVVAKIAIKGESGKKKNEYIDKEVAKKVNQGLDKAEVTKMIRNKIENKTISTEDTFITNDGYEVSIYEILVDPAKYNKMYIKDPLEPNEQSKAIINSESIENINIFSFVHGGTTYKIIPTLNSILKLLDDKRLAKWN